MRSFMPPTIIIVEDFDVIRNLLCQSLSNSYECLPFHSAEKAIEVLESRTTDLVITDVKLPGMDGYEFLLLLRERWPRVPVIIITGGYEAIKERDFLEAGAAGYLLKPFTMKDVDEEIERVLASTGSR